jgi:hypothetical protein
MKTHKQRIVSNVTGHVLLVKLMINVSYAEVIELLCQTVHAQLLVMKPMNIIVLNVTINV